RSFFTPTAIFANECTLEAVLVEHRSLGFVREPSGLTLPRAPRLVGCAELLLHELLDQEIERFFDDRPKVAARISMSGEVASELEFFFEPTTSRELHAVTVRA